VRRRSIVLAISGSIRNGHCISRGVAQAGTGLAEQFESEKLRNWLETAKTHMVEHLDRFREEDGGRQQQQMAMMMLGANPPSREDRLREYQVNLLVGNSGGKRSPPPFCHTAATKRSTRQAHLVAQAEDWRWSGLWRRLHGRDTQLLSEWPVPRPDDWLQRGNQPLNNSELAAIARSIRRGVPVGCPEWIARTANRLGLEHTLRSPGRPRLARH
jgi:hypothetical protein